MQFRESLHLATVKVIVLNFKVLTHHLMDTFISVRHNRIRWLPKTSSGLCGQ